MGSLETTLGPVVALFALAGAYYSWYVQVLIILLMIATLLRTIWQRGVSPTNSAVPLDRLSLARAVKTIEKFDETARSIVNSKSQRYLQMSERHMAEGMSALRRYSDIRQKLSANSKLMSDLAAFGKDRLGLTTMEVAFAKPNSNTIDIFNHMIRDWSTLNLKSRNKLFEPIWNWLASPKKRPSIFVPGAGVGRLACEAANRGYKVDALEISPEMHIASLFASSNSKDYPVYPWLLEYSHWRNASDQLVESSVKLETADVNFIYGDFLTMNTDKKYDAIITLFFMDTAENVLTYIDRISELLAPNGVWINQGPLKWGTKPKVEFAMDELLLVLKKRGWKLDIIEGHTNRYSGSDASLWHAKYGLVGWKAQRVVQ